MASRNTRHFEPPNVLRFIAEILSLKGIVLFGPRNFTSPQFRSNFKNTNLPDYKKVMSQVDDCWPQTQLRRRQSMNDKLKQTSTQYKQVNVCKIQKV